MERDSIFEKVKQWKDSSAYETGEYKEAFNYLVDLVKESFLKTKNGVPLHLIPVFLKKHGLCEDMVQAVGFDSFSHFLFHLENILEVRGKKISGRIFYFIFMKDKLRRAVEFRGNDADNDVEGFFGMECTYEATFPASYSLILNLYRSALIAPCLDKDFSICVKTSSEWKEESRKKKSAQSTLGADAMATAKALSSMKPKREASGNEEGKHTRRVRFVGP